MIEPSKNISCFVCPPYCARIFVARYLIGFASAGAMFRLLNIFLPSVSY